MSGQIHSPGDPHPHHVSLSGALPYQLPHRATGSPASVKPICHQAAPSPSPPAPAQQQTLSQRHQPLHLSSSASTLPSWGKLRHHLNKKPQSPYRWSACHFHGRCPGQHQNCSEKHCPPDGKEGGENGSGTKQVQPPAPSPGRASMRLYRVAPPGRQPTGRLGLLKPLTRVCRVDGRSGSTAMNGTGARR